MTSATSSAMRLTAAVVTQYLTARKSLTASLTGARPRRVVLLRSIPVWDGAAELSWGEGRRARVAVAPSPLFVHELVLRHLASDGAPQVLVVLTDREESELDPAILARAHKRRIQTVDGWDVVREAFGAEQVELRLREAGWTAEALLDATPPGGWPRLAGGVLSRRAALTELALRRLAIGRYGADPARRDDGLDPHSLLRWSLETGGPDRLLALRVPEQQGLAAFLGEDDQAGMAGRALLALVRAGHGADAVPFGLLCAALWRHAEATKTTYQARGRAERWFGDPPPAVGDALDAMAVAFGEASEEYLVALLERAEETRGDGAAQEARRLSVTVLNRARFLSRQFAAEDAAAVSPVLEAGLEARFATVGRALAAGDARAVSAAVRELRRHRLAGSERARIERVCMAQRLMQWLAGDPEIECATVAAGIQRQIAEIGWTDRALEHLEAGGDSDPGLGAAYDTLGTRIRQRRRRIDHAFARRLATWTASGTDPGAMLTVETFLRRVVPPVLKNGVRRRLLLLVLDGMSAAVACELAEEITKTWEEYDPLPDEGPPRRRAMAAALPTLTAVSRSSLFAGALVQGGQAEEERLFPAHQFWGSAKAAVFHKDDLRAETTGDAYSPALTEALADGRTHIAIVLNTIDDRLAKEQKLGDGAWRLSDIGKLHDLMRTAANLGMAMILTSDHGHVVDRHGGKVDAVAAGSARHREPGGPLADAEIALAGPRVVWPEPGGSIVALWDADSRYTAQKAGYHGGASLAEFAIPVLAFLPYGAVAPKAWRAIGGQAPAWWPVDEVVGVSAAPPASRRQGRGGGRRVRDQDTALFDVAPVVAPRQDAREEALVRALLSSEAFQAQMGLLTRKPATETVERALVALLEAGTLPVTALAQRAGLAAPRADGFAAVLRGLLNFDGVQVLETLPDGRTLRLDTGLLREQFELGGTGQ